jgi:hypothetical protein
MKLLQNEIGIHAKVGSSLKAKELGSRSLSLSSGFPRMTLKIVLIFKPLIDEQLVHRNETVHYPLFFSLPCSDIR